MALSAYTFYIAGLFSGSFWLSYPLNLFVSFPDIGRGVGRSGFS
jgi:hypothetical protein